MKQLKYVFLALALLFPLVASANTPLLLGTSILIQPGTNTVLSAYPTYANKFVATNNPFLMTWTQLHAVSNQSAQPTNAAGMSKGMWSQLGGGQTTSAIPLYLMNSSNPAQKVSCNTVGYGCSADGVTLHFPSGYIVQNPNDTSGDLHLTGVDLTGGAGYEFWRCTGHTDSAITCGTGSKTLFSTKGIQQSTSATAGGYSELLWEITAGDLLNSGPITHALGINTECLYNDTATAGNHQSVYPSTRGNSGGPTDCQSPEPPYGAMWHLKTVADGGPNVDNLGYDVYCTKIVHAMQDYGIYTMDTGNGQLELEVENPVSYNYAPYTSNPFYKTIWPAVVSGGDGTGANSGFAWKGCFNHLNSSMFEIYYVPNLGY